MDEQGTYAERLRATLTTDGPPRPPFVLPAWVTAEHPFLVLPTEEEWAATGNPPLLIRKWLPQAYGGTPS